MLIDTHCHFDQEDSENLNLLIEEILKTDVKVLIVSGYDIKSSKTAIELANTFESVYATVGIHPHECLKVQEEDYKAIEMWMNEEKVVAIGEIGLDYYYDTDVIDEQKDLFERQLQIAEKYKKPVVVHNRDASEDVYNILRKYKVNGIIHCFNDDLIMANKFIELGFLLGVGGIITFKNSKLKNVIRDVPLEYIVLETDSPYLSPVPFRGKKNTPKNLPLVAETISQIKVIEYNKVASSTTYNAVKLFDIKGKL